VCFNPAPFDASVADYPLGLVDILVVNQTEGQGLSGKKSADNVLKALAAKLPKTQVILTLGARGAVSLHEGKKVAASGVKVKAVDTTAAGDTFIGYYLACRGRGMDVTASLRRSCAAAAVCVQRPGAMDSIPAWDEVSD
jgi:ribokinase